MLGLVLGLPRIHARTHARTCQDSMLGYVPSTSQLGSSARSLGLQLRQRLASPATGQPSEQSLTSTSPSAWSKFFAGCLGITWNV